MSSHVTLFGPNPRRILTATIKTLARHKALNLALASMTPPNRRLARQLIAAEVANAGYFNLVATMATAWRRHRQLQQAARRSVTPPYPTEVVRLGSFHVESNRPEQIDVMVNGTIVCVVRASLQLDIEVARFAGVVQGGRLVSVEARSFEVSAALAVEGAQVIRASARFDISTLIPLGQGIDLQ